MKKSLLLTFLKVFFLLFLSLNLWASDIVCNSIVLRILESHKEKLNQTSENFFKNVIVKTLGLYGLENGKSVRSYEFNGHEILFPLIENEKRLKIVLNENILESGISETKDKKIIHLKIGESKTEAQNLLRQALVGSKMHPYISSTLSKVERSALGLSPIMHKDVQSEMLRSAKIAMNNGDKKFLTVGPTGIGKTEVFVGVFKERLKNLKFKNKLHVVVSDQINLSLQHEAELSNLKNETPFKIIRWGDDLKSFKIEDLLEEIKNDDRPVVLVTTIQSFKNRYFEADNETIINLQNKMATMFYDEAHHTGADGAQKVIKTLIDENPNEVFLLGATATPVHAKTSIQEIFGNKAFFAYLDSSVSYQKKGQTFREVSEVVKQLEIAIKKGELTPFDRTYFLTADQLQVAESEMFVQLESLRFVLNPNAYLTLFKKISPLISLHHHGMITAANISEAKRLEQFLNHAFSKNTNKNFRALHSELTKLEREQIKEDYKNGKINFLIAVDMMNEGVRFPGMSLYIDLNKNVSAREFLQRIGRVLALEQGKSGVDVVSLMSLSDDGMRENIELINSISKGQLSINRAIKSTVPSRRDLENEQMEYISLNRHEMQKQLVNLKLSMEEFWNNQETGYKNGKLVLDWMILNFEQTKKISLPMQRVDRDKASKLEYKMAQAIIRNFEKEDFLKAFKNKEEYVDYLKLMEFKIETLKVNRMTDMSTSYLTGKSILDWMILNFEQTKKISLPIRKGGKDEASKLEVKMAQAIINNFYKEDFLKAFKEQAEYAEYLKLVEIRIAELEKVKKNQLTGNSHIYLRGKSVLDWMIENFERTKKISLPMLRVGRDKASKLEYNMAKAIKTNFDKEDFLRPFQENPKYDDYLKLIEMKITEIEKFKENQQVGISQDYLKGKRILDWMIENFERTKMMSLPIHRVGQDEASKLEAKMAIAIRTHFENEDFLKPFKENPEYADYLKLMESRIEKLRSNARIKDEN